MQIEMAGFPERLEGARIELVMSINDSKMVAGKVLSCEQY
jgi:hypothetical protein